jgi:hypothetical protein
MGFQEGQIVELVIGDRTDLGYKAMINNSQWVKDKAASLTQKNAIHSS